MIAFLLGCSPPILAEPPRVSEPVLARVETACSAVKGFVSMGRVGYGKLEETSGLVASRRHAALWLHNDSGGKPRLYAVGHDGRELGKVDIRGASARDWEDIALLPGEEHDWLLIGDIGDNDAERSSVQLYRVREPVPGVDTSAGMERMDVRYATGPQNAEVLLVDPRSSEIFILSKVSEGVSTLFEVGLWKQGEVTALAVGTYAFPAGYSSAKATGGDVGEKFMAIRTYSQIHLWELGPDLPATLAGTPCDVRTADEKQGEAVGFAFGGMVTISEGDHPKVHWAPMR